MLFQAHRGVSIKSLENTMPAFVAALEQYYQYLSWILPLRLMDSSIKPKE